MSDRDLRKLERAARAGDPSARQRYFAELFRVDRSDEVGRLWAGGLDRVQRLQLAGLGRLPDEGAEEWARPLVEDLVKVLEPLSAMGSWEMVVSAAEKECRRKIAELGEWQGASGIFCALGVLRDRARVRRALRVKRMPSIAVINGETYTLAVWENLLTEREYERHDQELDRVTPKGAERLQEKLELEREVRRVA